MPRKSPNEIALVSSIGDRRRRITAPAGTSPEEARLFYEIVNASHPMHFCQADATLLRSYCQAILLGELAFMQAQESPDHIDAWVKAVRAQATLGTKLRMTPHSRIDAKSVARAISRSMPYDDEARVRGWPTRSRTGANDSA